MPKAEITQRLREERERLGLTQAVLAARCGVSAPSQNGYESGTRVPDSEYLERAHLAGVDTHYILTGDREPQVPFDWAAHDSIQLTIENFLSDRGITLPFEKRMELVRYFMKRRDLNDKIDPKLIRETLELVA
ncbi:MAG: helix-turn-helix transcriptional regulator [Chromatiales bacterium]|nr:helix-turn-helix transcriptional regulator [Chromatiales bacterium]